ncbi:hypothetical protein GNF10_05715 [Nostoc sp. UCD121]|uniref:hypothetical protein n=1 Tax=unclassified Nostoc TaxID=2593658 RepID=UPI001624EFA3|nr:MULTISPECIES: hypothetical protein [unclassified Nostoc]MBC1222554.1 hypothetical protein [Nostoc sp. UCD120]MBC1275493.1 hypothetical protein [Nostoc sp. UCD121]MBC1294820.1 hypothetical protein [Nostoc sp. UCD122]
MLILSYVRPNAEVSYCIYRFVFMGGARLTNQCNRSAGCSDRFWTVYEVRTTLDKSQERSHLIHRFGSFC